MCCFAYKWAYKFLRFACLIRPEAKKQCFFVMFFSDLFFKEGNMANLFSKQSHGREKLFVQNLSDCRCFDVSFHKNS